MESTTVYPLTGEQLQELRRIMIVYDVYHFGVTDKGKIIIEYGSRFLATTTKIINP